MIPISCRFTDAYRTLTWAAASAIRGTASTTAMRAWPAARRYAAARPPAAGDGRGGGGWLGSGGRRARLDPQGGRVRAERAVLQRLDVLAFRARREAGAAGRAAGGGGRVTGVPA